MADDRVFSEQEVTEIIRRAVELTEAGDARSYTPGVTRQELEKIGSEVGVSPDALARAILEVQQRTGKRGPLHLTEEFERVVSGELNPDQFDLIVEGIKPLSNAGQPGMTQIGRTLTMSAWTGVGQAKVDLTSRSGRTRVKVRSSALFQGLMTLYPAAIGSVIAIGMLSERGMGLLGAAIGVAVLALGGGLFGWLTKLGHRKAESLADNLRERIEQTLRDQEPAGVELKEAESLEQRLSLDLGDESRT